MDHDLVERCAQALWKEYIKDPANRYHLNKLFKKPYTLTWAEANDPDIIPMFADQFRAKARVVIGETRRYLVAKKFEDKNVIYEAMFDNE